MVKLDLTEEDEEELFERLNKLERASEYYEIKIEELGERIKKIEIILRKSPNLMKNR